MSNQEPLRIHINPDNRRISIKDPEYVRARTEALEKTRSEYVTILRQQVDNGELELSVDLSNPSLDTPEKALLSLAHSSAEAAMQGWAVNRGIGLVGVTGGYDHGQVIEYVDDSAVPFLEYQIEEAA